VKLSGSSNMQRAAGRVHCGAGVGGVQVVARLLLSGDLCEAQNDAMPRIHLCRLQLVDGTRRRPFYAGKAGSTVRRFDCRSRVVVVDRIGWGRAMRSE
jgi:hypothetical protein